MAYNPYYAPYFRPMNYYNPSVPQDNQNMQGGQPFGQPIQQPPIQNPIQQSASWNDMLWVLNETEAISYPVAPNNSVTLWDKNKDTVYIKSVNAQGVPSIRILDYAERIAENAPKTAEKHVCQCDKEFVRADTFEGLQREFEAMRRELNEMKSKPKTKNKEIGETDDGE